MSKKYGACLFAAAAFLMLVITLGYRAEYRYSQKLVKEETAEKSNMNNVQENTISTQGEAEKNEVYCLGELNGYVVVYMNDSKNVYEYTNILISELPAVYQEQIKEGMIVEGTEKLYGFLENYSS
ncbi:MAG: hypothetical protein SPJ92_10410 [Bariatricus sp.]|nr:hypothetical protein [Bariatricus sp.]